MGLTDFFVDECNYEKIIKCKSLNVNMKHSIKKYTYSIRSTQSRSKLHGITVPQIERRYVVITQQLKINMFDIRRSRRTYNYSYYCNYKPFQPDV